MTRRRINTLELEVEVPGTPEQIWRAIATGPGITAWFMPAEVAEHEGGAVSFEGAGRTGGLAGRLALNRRTASSSRQRPPARPLAATVEVAAAARPHASPGGAG